MGSEEAVYNASLNSEGNKHSTLSQYFGSPTQNETVFDQLSVSTMVSAIAEAPSAHGACEMGKEAAESGTDFPDTKESRHSSSHNTDQQKACDNFNESIQPDTTLSDDAYYESKDSSNEREDFKLHEYFKNEDQVKSSELFNQITSNIHDISSDASRSTGFGDFCSEQSSEINRVINSFTQDTTPLGTSMEDPFISSLYSSDFERRHDAWIPSDITKIALMNMANSPPGTYFPEKDLLTLPSVLLENELEDPIYTLCKKQFGDLAHTKRQCITADNVTQDYRGVSELIKGGYYCAAINLTGRLLAMYGQNIGNVGLTCKHTVHSLQLWFTRLALLTKMRQSTLAESESEPFRDFDNPDLYFEWSPELYGGRKGSLVPFGMRLLVAILPMYSGKHKVALDRLLKVLRVVREIQSNLSEGLSEDGHMIELSPVSRSESLKLWNKREIETLQAILNCVIAQRDFLVALELLETLIEKDPGNSANIYSAMERVYLQVGDLNLAEITKEKARSLRANSTQDMVANTLDEVFIDIAKEDYSGACNKIDSVLDLDPHNVVLINNKAVCLVYMGKLPEALQLYESAIVSEPLKSMHEGFVCNLCTVYELGTSQLMEKKCRLLEHVARHKGDGFLVASLKFPL